MKVQKINEIFNEMLDNIKYIQRKTFIIKNDK